MLASSNKERLEQEIASLINFISSGRNYFFQQTSFSIASSDNWVNHFQVKDIFHKHRSLTQLELNIQLFYIKLMSYYQLTSKNIADDVLVPRNVFAHKLTDLVFHERVNYNFFLHKVTENFKKIQLLFYREDGDSAEVAVKTINLNLDEDIKKFLDSWNKSQ